MRKFFSISENEEQLLRHLEESGNSRPLDELELEKKLHEGESLNGQPMGLHGWARDHELRFPHFSTLKFSPGRYYWQRIGENTIYPSGLADILPSRLLVPVMRKKFIETIGPRAEAALYHYDHTPADEAVPLSQGGLSVTQKIGEILVSRQSLLVAVSHAESLDDIAVNQGPVAIAAASKSPRLIKRVGTSLSKTLTREKYKGKPVPHHFRFFGTIHLTIPDTSSTEKWAIPEEAKEKVSKSGMRSMMNDVKKGTAIVMAPTGAGMRMSPDAGQEGPQLLDMPGFSETTKGIIGRFGHFMVTAAWNDKVSVSSIHSLPNWEEAAKAEGKTKLSKKDKAEIMPKYLDQIRLELAQRTADVSQLPVRFETEVKVGKEAVKQIVFPRQVPEVGF